MRERRENERERQNQKEEKEYVTCSFIQRLSNIWT